MDPSFAGAQTTPDGAIEPQFPPKLVTGEDFPKTSGILIGDIESALNITPRALSDHLQIFWRRLSCQTRRG
jgi:hypothetical protein